ncbi:DUF4232 domain-containing protein [Streptomyces sp. GC420]|uniref:DUF4232 domain-containing protein n=1 Tax=Streptomyces sp. GC420 TaxID=2697568 RepID=UPI0014152BA4|nr:DUF4232 domain-containing protein [Streptomyces sp. GC420]NBM15604.1 DUF4232 domain-containing protein [Streptomyces sp. GC420]
MNAAACRSRKSSSGWRAYALGAGAIAALLATTACQPAADDAADESKSSARPSATSAATATSPGGSSGEGEEGEESGDTGGENDSGTPLCTLQDLSVSATNYDGKGEPVRHILLVATNTGDKKCDVQNAPEVMLGDAQGPAPVLEGDVPDEPVTLAPGEKAYAGLLATGGHMDTYEVEFMTLTLGSPGGEAEAEEPVELSMPAASFPADDGQRVTNWAGTEGLAMRPVTQR